MRLIDRIIGRGRKINGSAKTKAHLENLIMAAYEAGRADQRADILDMLCDDMLTEVHLDHMGAVDIIRSN